MKLLCVETAKGPDDKDHVFLREMGSRARHLADCGVATPRSLRHANLLAKAPVMLDMLEQLAVMAGNINPNFQLGAGFAIELKTLAERALSLSQSVKAPTARERSRLNVIPGSD